MCEALYVGDLAPFVYGVLVMNVQRCDQCSFDVFDHFVRDYEVVTYADVVLKALLEEVRVFLSLFMVPKLQSCNYIGCLLLFWYSFE